MPSSLGWSECYLSIAMDGKKPQNETGMKYIKCRLESSDIGIVEEFRPIKLTFYEINISL